MPWVAALLRIPVLLAKGAHYDGLRAERDALVVAIDRHVDEVEAVRRQLISEIHDAAENVRGLSEAQRRELAECRASNIRLAQRAEAAELRASEAGRP